MLTPRQLRQLLYCTAEELRARRAGKSPGVQPWNAELLRAVELELATSESGSEFDCANEESQAKVPISARQAADILCCSTRYIRDIAERIGGVRVDGRWLFDEDDVMAYAEGNDGRAAS
jgi:hypothetical protein